MFSFSTHTQISNSPSKLLPIKLILERIPELTFSLASSEIITFLPDPFCPATSVSFKSVKNMKQKHRRGLQQSGRQQDMSVNTATSVDKLSTIEWQLGLGRNLRERTIYQKQSLDI